MMWIFGLVRTSLGVATADLRDSEGFGQSKVLELAACSITSRHQSPRSSRTAHSIVTQRLDQFRNEAPKLLYAATTRVFIG